jgi:membrane fusion protein, multidrug efflux system
MIRAKILHWGRWAGRIGIFVAFTGGVVVLMLLLSGKFSKKVSMDVPAEKAEEPSAQVEAVPVRLIELPSYESAVGSVRAVHETSIGSKLLARVVEVNLKAGQDIHAGEVLVRLDDSDLQAKLEQARAAAAAAEATRKQAEADARRDEDLYRSHAVSRQEYERSATALSAANANLLRAKETVKEVQATLDWATIRSPIDGRVIDKKVDVGDMVTPGKELATLYDPKRMQLVASVRESLAQRLKVGETIGVHVEALKKTCAGTVSEIVPEAQSASHSFQVKVTGPCPPGIYSGMFGRLLIPLEEEERVLVIPKAARRVVGQLELVDVVAPSGRVSRRAIRTGRVLGENKELLEVLSGLSAEKHEKVLVPKEAGHE